jgi:hypothetical protein
MTQVVTIKGFIPLYKNGEEAINIHLVELNEILYKVVAQKTLYKIGDKALFILPDWCLPDRPEFDSYISPNGDPSKSKLGKNNRIRAIKFNFSQDINTTDVTYSMGILMPLNSFPDLDLTSDLSEQIGITKYEEPETSKSGMNKGYMPSGMYKTDETNIETYKNLTFPNIYSGSLKVDGSSITIYFRNSEEKGICSRNLEKQLNQSFVDYYTKGDEKITKYYHPELKCRGWIDEQKNFYNEPLEDWVPFYVEVDDTFIKLGLPILNKLEKWCLENNKQIALRGELCGSGLKGSGNKNNPHSKLKQNILFFGADDYSNGFTIPLPIETFTNICNELEIETSPIIFTKRFNNVDEIMDECDKYFKSNLVEGIVVRSLDSSISCKVMNKEYDSKK